VRRKLRTKASATGMKMRRPKYSVAITTPVAITSDDLEEALMFEELEE
jgi:hypothetical protein